MNTSSIFLQAEWRHLAVLNFPVDPAILRPFVPQGTEIDYWQDRAYLSMVGFLFLNTRVLGVRVPFHRDFEEVNLRFYVRRKTEDGWRRAVVFIKEIVPRAAIALVARALYNENYVALPMRHRLDRGDNGAGPVRSVSYEWRFSGRQNRLFVATTAIPSDIREGSEEEFIAEHYWGYAVQRDGAAVGYRVDHPRWRMARATDARLDCDVAQLYGEQFSEFLGDTPLSAFLAEGSEVTVFKGVRLAP